MAIEKYIEAGRITNTHGVAGEVKIEVWVDSPEFLKKCGRLFIDGVPVKMLGSKIQNKFLIVKLEGIDDVNKAMTLKGRTVYIDRADAPLKRGQFFLQDLIGAEVEDENGNPVGVLEELFESPASVIYVVRGEKEHMIPAVPEFILSEDAEKGKIRVHLIEGM